MAEPQVGVLIGRDVLESLDIRCLSEQFVIGSVDRLREAVAVLGGWYDDVELAASIENSSGEALIRAISHAAEALQIVGAVLSQFTTDAFIDQAHGVGR